MDTYKKKYNEALAWMRELYPGLHGATKEDAEHFFPELRESEDEMALRIIKKRMCYDPVPISDEDRRIVENWLEKQKEPEKEELVYRLNGLMQEYINEAKDQEEEEHRFKCYKLFWNALEDTSYFEKYCLENLI